MKHDHGFHPLRIAAVVAETVDARSFVLEPPSELRDSYHYQAGQFCTFRFRIEGEELLRCYSMSSAPEVDAEMKTTVKRVPGGRVSNHMIDRLAPGDTVEATLPAGVFCLTDDPTPVVAFGGGSGITPVISIVKSALATTDRSVRLFYANRTRESVIFSQELDQLVARHAEQFDLVHHVDAERGYATATEIEEVVTDAPDAHFYLCGPTPFMDLVEETLQSVGVPDDRVHTERFVAPAAPAASPASVPDESISVRITLHGQAKDLEHQQNETLLDAARRAGLRPPFSCEAGNCATCMARLVEGTVQMRQNHVLLPDEVEEGWVLTCQSVPTSERVVVVYED